MLESILAAASTTTTTELTLEQVLTCTVASLVIGLVISLVYRMCSNRYSKNYVITLVILPVLVQVVIMMVNGNLGTGVAILGAFSLVRFRSIPGSSKEISVIFFAMAIGLATGMGYIGFAVLITILISAVLLILNKLNYGGKSIEHKVLKITIPENLNFDHIFDEILQENTKEFHLERIKSTNMGSMFELTYDIVMDPDTNMKSMIDEIRCRNGNLTVFLGKAETSGEEL